LIGEQGKSLSFCQDKEGSHPSPIIIPSGNGGQLTQPQDQALNSYPDTKYAPYGLSNSQPITIGEFVLTLPGKGNNKTHCGDVRYAVACSDEGCSHHEHFKLKYDHCDRLTCPTCHPWAERRLARKAQERIDGMRTEYEARGQHFGHLDHVVFSPPQDMFSEEELATREGYQAAHEWANEFLNENVQNLAGCYMFHPWRAKHQDGTTCEDDHCQKRHIWLYGPHFHYVGYGWWKRSDIVYRETGAVYTKIRPGEKRDIFKTISYEANHCGVLMEAVEVIHDGHTVKGTTELRQRGKTLRWVGQFATCKGGYHKEGTIEEIVTCDHCQHEVHQYSVDIDTGKPKLFLDIGPHTRKKNYGTWHLNIKHSQAKIGSPKRRGANHVRNRTNEEVKPDQLATS